MKYAFAGNRDIAVWILEFLISKSCYPEALMITESDSTESKQLKVLSELPEDSIFVGRPQSELIQILKGLDLDYIIGIHYPYIISNKILDIPKIGFLNLHPAYLPFNRGWHTPSWAILDGTPAGATLHFMSEALDRGDIIHQKKLDIHISDTANSLYQKLKQLELEVFQEVFDDMNTLKLSRQKQDNNIGTSHKKAELFKNEIAALDLSSTYELEPLLNKLRALTTNDINEACFFEKDGKKYRIQVDIKEVN